MPDAELYFHDKAILEDGSILEMTIWKLPKPDAERPHGLKYRLYYGKSQARLVGYDNERGKGDHRHIRHREEPYRFVSVEKLIEDFLTDVEQQRGGK